VGDRGGAPLRGLFEDLVGFVWGCFVYFAVYHTPFHWAVIPEKYSALNYDSFVETVLHRDTGDA
jgi:hypothetical protein